MSDPSPHLEVRRFGSTDAIRLGVLIWPCYDEVFGDFDDFRTWSDDLFRRHATRSGYRLVVATDGSAVAAEGSAIAGFGWGYIGERGQYWTDLVCDALPGSVTDEWVGGHFEFVELAVAPQYRRRGLGRRLHDTLLEGLSQRALLSTTDDLADPAVQLYLSSGWRKLGVLRPGTQVMGRSAGQIPPIPSIL
jgi:ribosomal protein S18 acetylase RimI-like enzyme